MTTVREIDTTLQRRRFHRLRAVPKWRVELAGALTEHWGGVHPDGRMRCTNCDRPMKETR